jgi:UDP-glucose 4-epimerase
VRAAVKRGVKRLIYLSTAHVYGRPLAGVITEDTCPTSLHPYATTHRAAEDAVRCAGEKEDIDGIVIRLSNAYGAPAHKDTDSWTLLVNDLCRQAVSTQCMLLRSSGLERRDFVPLPDVCAAIEHLLSVPARERPGHVFNVGGEWAPTVWEMACTVQERCALTLGFRPQLSRPAPQPGEVATELHLRLDGLLRIGFKPRSDRLAEIDRLLAFCRESFGSVCRTGQ